MKSFGQWDEAQHCIKIPAAGKIVITVKLIAPVAWIFDRQHVTVVAFSGENRS